MVRLGGTKMSKTKGNLVAPEDILDAEGADALRLAHLFSGPPADDVDWEGVSVEGCSRFLHRLWRLAAPGSDVVPPAEGEAVLAVDREAHRLIQRITEAFEKWSYNTAVAHFMEFTNVLYKRGTTDFAIDTLLQLLAPAAPHITAELWALRHAGEHVHERAWPVADAELAKVDSVTLVVQVNGKLRDRIEVDAGIDEAAAEAAALASPKVLEALDGATPKKVIARPPKLVNIVV
jgi:leucyl-tRNA synthetase